MISSFQFPDKDSASRGQNQIYSNSAEAQHVRTKTCLSQNVPDAESNSREAPPDSLSPKRSSSPTDDPDNPDNRSGLPCNSLRSLSFRRHPHPKPKKIITINKIYHPKRKYLFNETKICIYL
jgi:hypothetical protein